tara:strand:- start:8783 stop:10156 length:1374 start_codon:yes stop_codon:yes gene_type:complete
MVKFVSKIDARAEDVYTWHQNFGANERLSPPWMTTKLLRQEHNENETLQYVKTNYGLQVEKTINNPAKRSIISETIRSSQQSIQTIKNFDKLDDKTVINETISVNWFTSFLPRFIIDSMIENKLEKEFHFRGKRIENDLREHARFAAMPRQNIAILGSESTVAQQFKPFFTSGNHTVFSFVKRKPYPTAREIQLNTSNGHVGLNKLKDIDSVIFFPINEKDKITDENFDALLETKLSELRFLIQAFKNNNKFPSTFVMMSSTCVYKEAISTVDETNQVDAESKISLFFLKLEKELEQLRTAGTRVINARMGNVLTAKTGILRRAINKQKFGFCRQMLDEKQLNWISLDDAIYATNKMLLDPKMFGTINVCSSMSIKANDLHLLLAQKTKRPLLFRLPKFVFNLATGNVKHDQILQNSAVYPQRLKQFGFTFNFENIDDALNWETGNFTRETKISSFY